MVGNRWQLHGFSGWAIHRIRAWDTSASEDRCTVAQLRKLAEIYKRPLAVFYLPEPPKDFDALRDFRRLAAPDVMEKSPNLAAEIRWAHQIREVALETFALADVEATELAANTKLTTDAATTATKIRGLLDISLETQHGWRCHYDALDGWRSAIEAAGVICVQFTGVSVYEARGFSIAGDRLPLIAVNAKDAATARVFSLIHELTHLLLGAAGKCNFHEAKRATRDVDKVEVYCNRVAGETLLPRAALLGEPAVRCHTGGMTWRRDELGELVARYNVSEEVVLRRLLTLGLTDQAFYEAKRKQYLEAASQEKKPGGGDYYYRNMKGKLGRSVIVAVMSAWQQGRITANDASAYLGVKVGKLPRLLDAAVQ
jgi:Zn-dependent peptidase ImmA (M78 family)